MSRIVGLIQARMGSSRLPGKVMLPLAGRPIVWHILDRLSRTPAVERCILATTQDPANNDLVDWAKSLDILVYRAAIEDDLAERLSGAAQIADADFVLKVNGDCPLIDPDVLSQLVSDVDAEPNLDYVSNKIVMSYPLGLSAEVISRRALDWCDRHLITSFDREYVADWIRNHPAKFRVRSIEGDRNLSHHHWMVDNLDDYRFMSRVFDELYRTGSIFGLDEVLEFVNATSKAESGHSKAAHAK